MAGRVADGPTAQQGAGWCQRLHAGAGDRSPVGRGSTDPWALTEPVQNLRIQAHLPLPGGGGRGEPLGVTSACWVTSALWAQFACVSEEERPQQQAQLLLNATSERAVTGRWLSVVALEWLTWGRACSRTAVQSRGRDSVPGPADALSNGRLDGDAQSEHSPRGLCDGRGCVTRGLQAEGTPRTVIPRISAV